MPATTYMRNNIRLKIVPSCKQNIASRKPPLNGINFLILYLRSCGLIIYNIRNRNSASEIGNLQLRTCPALHRLLCFVENRQCSMQRLSSVQMIVVSLFFYHEKATVLLSFGRIFTHFGVNHVSSFLVDV